MSRLLQLFLVLGVIAAAFLAVTVGFVRHDIDLLAPVHLAVFVIALAIYLLPSGLAVYRDCTSTVWIVLVNVLLGWTILGWAAAMGWAASGKVRELPAAGVAHHAVGH